MSHPHEHHLVSVAVASTRPYGRMTCGHGRDVSNGDAVSFVGIGAQLDSIEAALRAGSGPVRADVPCWAIYARGESAQRLNRAGETRID